MNHRHQCLLSRLVREYQPMRHTMGLGPTGLRCAWCDTVVPFRQSFDAAEEHKPGCPYVAAVQALDLEQAESSPARDYWVDRSHPVLYQVKTHLAQITTFGSSSRVVATCNYPDDAERIAQALRLLEQQQEQERVQGQPLSTGHLA